MVSRSIVGHRQGAGALASESVHRLPGKLSALASLRLRLFCYHDAAGYKGVHLRDVHIQDNEIRRFEDVAVTIDLAAKAVNHGFVVATRPLSRSGWLSFHPGGLIVYEKGVLRFSSHS